uniref:Uncharacterized protein n=1 Tax=Anguilla anguilla TaxID=7936 RepID=A0A0E9RRB2_ANGAN
MKNSYFIGDSSGVVWFIAIHIKPQRSF